jgi:hypothetical protein
MSVFAMIIIQLMIIVLNPRTIIAREGHLLKLLIDLIRDFFWLVNQGLSGIPYEWPVIVALVVVVASALFWTFLLKKTPIKPSLLWLIAPIFITILIFTLGTIFKNSGLSSSTELVWPVYFVYGFFLAHIPIAVILMFRFRNYKFLALAVSALITWISLWAAFVSVMSITGDWL